LSLLSDGPAPDPNGSIAMAQIPKTADLAMKPMKNTATTEAKITARRKFFFFCSGVVMASGTVGEDPSHQATIFVAEALSLGGSSKVWNGAGDGTSHSRPSAPSQGCCGAGWPLLRIIGMTTKTKK
jgi:hypothetical protein